MPTAQTNTLLFADVSGSTRLFELRGDVEARRLIALVLDTLSDITRRHDGRVIKTIGDEIMCAFPGPRDGLDAALAMQRRMASDARFTSENLAIRVGLHHGDVLLEDDGDVFGDAVNTAARMASQAKREQIVTTASTVEGLRGYECRDLGEVRVNGKIHPIPIVDLVWQENTAGMTMVQSVVRLADAGLSHRLVIEFKGRVIELNPASEPLSLGRDAANGVVVEADWVSRSHALVEYKRGHYLFSDRSTNGSFVAVEGDPELRVHRDELQLRKRGVISLGKAAAENRADLLIHFRCD